MRKLPDLQKFRVFFLSNYFIYIFVKLYFLCCFVNFRVLTRLNDLWRFTTVTVLMSATKRDNASHTNSSNNNTWPTVQENTDKQTQCRSQKVIHAILTHKPTV